MIVGRLGVLNEFLSYDIFNLLGYNSIISQEVFVLKI